MAAAGNDLHQTLAILTGAGEITQNVSELSGSLQVISMRLRGMKDELQSIGEEYEDIESITKIQEQISNLTNGSVNILKTAAINTTLLNTALNAGIFFVASLAIQGIAKALDNYKIL